MSTQMKRREFITLLGGAAAAPSLFWPRAMLAQQGERIRRVGVLMNGAPTNEAAQSYYAAFTQTLQRLGWRDGQNLRVDLRWSVGDAERMRVYAEELVGLKPDLILSSSTGNLTALLRATRTIPIVFIQVSDPVAQGFVPNLVHPGGNITGFSAYEFSMGGKWVDLLKQIVPGLARIGIMSNPDTSPQSKLFIRSIEAAASSIGAQSVAVPVRDDTEIGRAIESFAREPNVGLVLPTDTFLSQHRKTIVDLTTRYRLPGIYAERSIVSSGGLMCYGIDFDNQFRQAAVYVDRVLKGANPGDLPVQLPTKFTLVINLKAARALGIDVPMGVLLSTDEVIE